MVNNELKRCADHIRHIQGELDRLEKEVSKIIEKQENEASQTVKFPEKVNTPDMVKIQEEAKLPVQSKTPREESLAVIKELVEKAEPVSKEPVNVDEELKTVAVVQKEKAALPVTVVDEKKVATESAENKMPHEKDKSEVISETDVVKDFFDEEISNLKREPKEEYVVTNETYEIKKETINNTVKRDFKNLDFESVVGKVLMGIFASVLVFVSLIVFAIWAVPKFNDITKMILMYSVSIIIAGVGLIMLIRDKKNKWYLSVSACGMGALYISFLVTRLHFGMISDLTLYILFFVWAVVICVLSRLRSVLFLIIGQIGMVISTFLGIVYALQENDGTKLLYIVIYFIIAETVFLVSHYQKEFYKNAINLVSFFVAAIPLALACCFRIENNASMGILAANIVMVILILLVVLFMLAFKHEKIWDGVGLAFGNILSISLVLLLFHSHFPDGGQLAYIFLLLIVVGTELLRKLKYDKSVNISTSLYYFQAIIVCILVIETLCCRELRLYVGIAPLAIAALIYGYITKNTFYKSFGYLFASTCIFVPMNGWMYVIWGFAVAITIALLQSALKTQYSTVIKTIAYPAFLLFLIIGTIVIWHYKLQLSYNSGMFVCILLILTVVNIIFSKFCALYTNLSNGLVEDEFRIETGFIHVCLMGVAVLEILVIGETGEHGLAVFLGVVLFAVNTYEILTYLGMKWGTLVTSLKALALVIVIMISYNTADYVFSVVILGMALIFLIIGFGLEYTKEINMKPTRITGLVMTILCTFKLLLVDIHLDDKVFLAINLFISGLICFAISFLYNLIDKKISAKE